MLYSCYKQYFWVAINGSLPDAELRELDDAQSHGVRQRAPVHEHAAQLVHLAVLRRAAAHAAAAHRAAVRLCHFIIIITKKVDPFRRIS